MSCKESQRISEDLSLRSDGLLASFTPSVFVWPLPCSVSAFLLSCTAVDQIHDNLVLFQLLRLLSAAPLLQLLSSIPPSARTKATCNDDRDGSYSYEDDYSCDDEQRTAN